LPELPEVETLARDLGRTLVGRTIVGVDVHKPKLFQPAPGLGLVDLTSRRVERLWRRGKYLVWDLSGAYSLVVHLKLAGQLVHIDAEGNELAHGGHPVPGWGTPMPHKATHVVFHLDDGSVLFLTDIRQFARLALMPDAAVPAFLRRQRLGPEPLSRRFTAAQLRARLDRRGIPLKTALLDQSVVGGLGNIYADESLWRARLHPRRVASSLTPREVTRLHRGIRAVLDYAVREGVAFVPLGKTISDREFPYVHGRAGSPCRRCGTIIQKDRVGGRGTHFCPKCQLLAPLAVRGTRSGVREDAPLEPRTPNPEPSAHA
jgi:formamidopyrimidine-DNA glycosylase